MKPKQIKTLAGLIKASRNGKAVHCPQGRMFTTRHMPATFVASMHGHVIHRLINCGLFIYDRPNSKANPPARANSRTIPRNPSS